MVEVWFLLALSFWWLLFVDFSVSVRLVGRVGLFFLYVEVNALSQWKIIAPVDGQYQWRLSSGIVFLYPVK